MARSPDCFLFFGGYFFENFNIRCSGQQWGRFGKHFLKVGCFTVNFQGLLICIFFIEHKLSRIAFCAVQDVDKRFFFGCDLGYY